MISHKIFPEHVLALTSTREEDFSFQGPDCQVSAPQVFSLIKQLGTAALPIIRLKQIHGAKVYIAEDVIRHGEMLVEGDALICQQCNIPIMIRTADCQPIFIYDKKTEAMALVHAGWRSTEQKILIETLALMSKVYGTQSKDVQMLLGVSLRKCCYEVGVEFEKHFPEDVSFFNGRRIFDLVGANKRQALAAGVSLDMIIDTQECTGCLADKYFSYRREKEQAGRMIHVMMKRR